MGSEMCIRDRSRGPRGDLHPSVGKLDHPAATLLKELPTEGARAETTTPPWTKSRLQAALKRGPHRSAKEHIEFLRGGYTDMMHMGHWILLPARSLLSEDELLKVLRLSPLGVVPQCDRRPRTISDYTYSVSYTHLTLPTICSV